ncbi:hypothetical protein D3C76_1797510 [compost metagenome]
MDALPQPADLTTRNEIQMLAIKLEFQGILDAANVADADRQEWPIELVICEIFLDTQLRRH